MTGTITTLSDALNEIIRLKGDEILRNKELVISYFTDIAPNLKKEKIQLEFVMVSGVWDEIIKAKSKSDNEKERIITRSGKNLTSLGIEAAVVVELLVGICDVVFSGCKLNLSNIECHKKTDNMQIVPTTQLNLEKEVIKKRLKKTKIELVELLMSDPITIARESAEFNRKSDDIDWIFDKAKSIEESNNDDIIKLQKEITFLLGREGFENSIIKDNNFYSIQGDSSDYVLKTIGNNGEIEISKYLGVDKDEIIIPGSINGKQVISVDKQAYIGLKNVKSIIVSEGIETLGCFNSCVSLSKIKLPDSLLTIKSSMPGTFTNTSLTDVVLPEKLKSLPMLCFSGCKKLRAVQIGSHVTDIGICAFSDCPCLKRIVLPGTIKEISDITFFRCIGLEEIIISEGTTDIGDSIISDCLSLKKLVFPSSLINISEKMFLSADKKEIIIPKDLMIYCHDGSVGLQFARNNNIRYTIIT